MKNEKVTKGRIIGLAGPCSFFSFGIYSKKLNVYHQSKAHFPKSPRGIHPWAIGQLKPMGHGHILYGNKKGKLQRNPAIVHFKGPVDFMQEMPYCQYIELKEKASRDVEFILS